MQMRESERSRTISCSRLGGRIPMTASVMPARAAGVVSLAMIAAPFGE
jgi:hypothetical protein